jgi:hypothetical protein
MTKQDKKNFDITIGDFDRDFPTRDYSYPFNRLSEFLNFSSRDENEIKDFCKKYKLIPPIDLEKGIFWVEAFKQLQVMLRTLVYHLQRSSMTPEMLEKLNKGLSGIRLVAGYPNSSNFYLKGVSNPTNVFQKEQIKPNHILLSYSDKNGISSLFLDVVTLTMVNQRLINCAWCGKFITLQSRQHRKYCNDLCKQNARDDRKKQKM